MADAVKWINVNPADEFEDRAKFRLAFRDVIDWGDLVWNLSPPMDLEEKANKFWEVLPGGPLAYCVSQPVIGASGTVFVIDIRAKTDAPMVPIRNAMATITDTVPGLELESCELVSSSEGSEAATTNRERTFQAAADIDAIRDVEANPFAGPVDAVNKAITGVSVAAVLFVGIAGVMLLRKYAR